MGVTKRETVGTCKGGPSLDWGRRDISGKTSWEVNFKLDPKMKL